MSSSSVSSSPEGGPSQSMWLLPYATSSVAAGASIVPVAGLMAQKGAQQKEKPLPTLTIRQVILEGSKTAPTVSVIVGTQMVLQQVVEVSLFGKENTSLPSKLGSSTIVGMLSAPFLAIYNGQIVGLSIKETLHKFTPRQAIAISVQETAFVAGLAAADEVGSFMKQTCGDNKVVEYFAAFISGAAGSFAGHPANTALTRWQNGLALTSAKQAYLGATRKTLAVGIFSVVYKAIKETLNAALT